MREPLRKPGFPAEKFQHNAGAKNTSLDALQRVRGMASLSPHRLCPEVGRRTQCQQARASQPWFLPGGRVRARVRPCLPPLCETLAEARFSLAPSRVQSPGLQDSGAGRSWEKRRSAPRGRLILWTKWQTPQRILPTALWGPLARGFLPTGPWAPPVLCTWPPAPHPIPSPWSQLSVPALPVVRAGIGRWLVAPEKQLESGGQGETTTGALVLPMGKQKAGGQPVAWGTAGWREGMQAYEFCHRGSKKQPYHTEGLRKPQNPQQGWHRAILSQSQLVMTKEVTATTNAKPAMQDFVGHKNSRKGDTIKGSQ